MAVERYRSLILDRNSQPFHYDREATSFVLNGQAIPIADLNGESFRQYMTPRQDSIESADELLYSEALLINPLQAMVSLPVFYDALQQGLLDETMQEETMDVMAEVYASDPGLTAYQRKLVMSAVTLSGFRGVGGNGGFSIEDTSDAEDVHPFISMTVPGICACLTTNQYGRIPYSEWGDKVVEYREHNVALPWQQYALFAGLGHLALAAKQQ